MWKKAKTLIPGGTMLFSKRPELHLPDNWPTYYKSAKGYKVTDLDDKTYKDLLFLVGTNTLGYANQKIDNAVQQSIRKSNMSSLNNFQEVELAEKLVDIHPYLDMVRFARSGAEANTIAIRIARAASGLDNIAFCGYHGWHDWYLSSNLNNKESLNSHLLNNLNIKGVNNKLKKTVFPFEFNDYSKLEKLINQNKIGTIIMEVHRTLKPNIEFLKKVRKLCNKKNIVLIFDECTSGFRCNFGGIHKIYKVYPDMIMLGKALGNGYAINAIMGKRNIMEYAQSSFISSTFWTEKIGSVAALKTLEIMKDIKSWKIITELGKIVKKNWKAIADNTGFELSIGGIDAIPSFSFKNVDNLLYKTYFTQEMLNRKYLASNLIYLSTVHQKVISRYLDDMNSVFFEMSHKDDDKLKNKLSGPVSEQFFKRIN